LVTLEDVLDVRRRVLELIPQGQPPVVHSLFEIAGIEDFKFGLAEFLATPRQVSFTPEQQALLGGWRVYYGGDNKAFAFFMSVFHQANHHQVAWLPDLSTALGLLAEKDDSLLDLLPSLATD
jgi:hypothetical protein